MSPAQLGTRTGLDWIDPVEALARFEAEPYTLLLYGGGADPRGRYSYLCAFPDRIIEETEPEAGFARLRAGHRPRPAEAADGRFGGGYAGLLGYELGAAFEHLPPRPAGLTDWPALALGWYPAVLVFDHVDQALIVAGDPAAAARMLDRLTRPAAPRPSHQALGDLKPVWSEARYLSAAAKARDYVRAGEVFQVNLSHPFRAELSGPDAPYAVFRRLAAQSQAAFSAYFRLDADRVIVTNSPERFVQLSSEGRVEARPIKGTRPRRADPTADRAEANALAASAKDRAENLMIVDLMRNDLARVCAPGSVKVPELFEVEAFANVHHLVSTVEGRLAPGRDVFDLLAASFPPGSITGAPKPRAMEIIAELEGEARGPYCGALGWIGTDGAADFNVMIRTAAFHRGAMGWRAEVRSGGAITIESDPAAELAETRAKAAALKRAIEDDHG